MYNQAVYLLLIALALFVVSNRNLRHAILGVEIFSLLASVCYLMFHAPDVAIAEAVIGSALSVILYIVALKKYRQFHVYYTSGNTSDYHMRRKNLSIFRRIMDYCELHELEVHVIYTWEPAEEIFKKHDFDLIVAQTDTHVQIYGSDMDDHFTGIWEAVKGHSGAGRVTFSDIQELKKGERADG